MTNFRFFKNEITSQRMLIGLILITKFTYSQENLSCVCRNVTYHKLWKDVQSLFFISLVSQWYKLHCRVHHLVNKRTLNQVLHSSMRPWSFFAADRYQFVNMGFKIDYSKARYLFSDWLGEQTSQHQFENSTRLWKP